jgi:hypothetical protein
MCVLMTWKNVSCLGQVNINFALNRASTSALDDDTRQLIRTSVEMDGEKWLRPDPYELVLRNNVKFTGIEFMILR